MLLTRAYAAATPPKPATFMCSRSMPRSRAAMAQAGIWIGMGMRVSFAAGFAKMTEKMSPRRIESFPAYGRTKPYSMFWVNSKSEPRPIDSTITLAKKTLPCIMPRLWHKSPIIRLSMRKAKKLVWLKWQKNSEWM